MLVTILIFIAILGIVVLSHEFGHFIVAKKAGMRVEEFGFGFPPRLFGFKKGETLYSINLLPVGGFVKIFGEDGGERQDPKSFSSNSVFARSLVIVAGVVMNIILAYALFSASHMLGILTVVSSDEPLSGNVSDVAVYIVAVNAGSPASQGGLKAGDKITTLVADGERLSVSFVSEVQEFIEANRGEEVVFTVARGTESLDLNVAVREEDPEEEGLTGIGLERAGILRQPLHTALFEGAKTTYNFSVLSVAAFGRVISDAISTGKISQDVSGPLGIAVMTGTVKDLGFVYILQFIGLISLSLGIINIVPFPALDGGRFAFLIAEKIKGSPLPQRFEGYANVAGFAALILLIILITVHDVKKFF